ncbi:MULTISPECIES: D-sedoheptulose 7-phosphate isomerase [Calditerrivibrio]|uniref:Phosphoheptose isomerase n=1 Tax=Calditerrivibrio nitroreducens TaxID=477976 RepID=A0A2J6WGK5_9BACT|nr:MAG: phosphoheptose isomerase [Calditerrivibrio nitroreducens]
MERYIEEIINDVRSVQNRFFSEAAPLLLEISRDIANTFLSGGKLLICGNGGSAADSQHMAAEFVNRFKMERPPLPAIALTTDTSIITSIGNDYSFEDIFSKQVEALGTEKDILIGISTSGNSPNILKALRSASKIGMKVIGFTGKTGGKMVGLCDKIVKVDTDVTARIQEIHIISFHIICGLVDEILFGKFSEVE